MKFFTAAAVLAASASTATALTNPFANDTLSGCGTCKPFTIEVHRGATDPSKGLSRDAILTNGTLPGPALHLKQGECVDFTVINNIGDDTGVHFHGIRQLETPWSDGTPGLSQKAIHTGQTYTYRWLADEPGVYFYHAHYKAQMMDGLYGAIVISAAEGTVKSYAGLGDVAALEAAEAKIETVFASDWNQFTAAEFLGIQKNANIDDACTDSIILNGQGSVYCLSQAQITANQRPQVPAILQPNTTLTNKGCIPPSNPLIQGNYTRNLQSLPFGAYEGCVPHVGTNYTYEVDAADGWAAMSFISPSGFTLLAATIDGHKMYVFEVNGQYIIPQVVDQITVTPGDRVSFFVKLDQIPGDYTIRVANNGLNQVISGFGTLRYKGSKGPAQAAALMNFGGVSPPNTTVVALNNAKSVPFAAPVVGQKADKTFVMDILKTPGSTESWSWVLNGVTPYSQENDDQTPFLYQGPDAVPQSDLVLRTNYNDWVDLIIVIAGPLAQPHPIHKHANKFYVIGSGVGPFNYSSVAEAQAAGVAFNLVNPPYLDGFTNSPAQGNSAWMVFRYQANTPGAWFMHCHIQTHFSGGMAVAILDGVDKWPALPTNPGQICSGNSTGPIGGGNSTGPIGGGNGTHTSTTTKSGSGSGATSTASHGWGGWGDWTSADSTATHVPIKGSTTGRPTRPTGVHGGDSNYNSDDWQKWSSIESYASSVSRHGGAGNTVDPTWVAWDDAATTTSQTKATGTAKTTGTVKTSSKSVDASSSATGTRAEWDSSNTATSSADWSTWTGVDGSSSVKPTTAASASASWSTWTVADGATGVAGASVDAASATGVASYTGGNVGGIATYHGAAASIKAGSVMGGAFVAGAVALLL